MTSLFQTILERPNYRLRAQQFQQEMKALPPLSEAVKRLEILAQNREPQVSGW